jgi:hypothetical protein
MKKAFTRFLLTLSAFLLLLVIWLIFEAQRAIINPSPMELEQISGSAIVISKDQGSVCVSVHEQTGKVLASLSQSWPVQEMYARPLFQTARCKAAGSEIKCSSLIVASVQKAACRFEPWMCKPYVSTRTHPFHLPEGTYDVFLGEHYKGQLIVYTNDSAPSTGCKPILGAVEISIPSTPAWILPEGKVNTPTGFTGYPVTGYPPMIAPTPVPTIPYRRPLIPTVRPTALIDSHSK